MTVVPQPAVQLRRATKADLPALLNLVEKQFQALQNRNNPGALPTSCPTGPKKNPHYQIWYDRLLATIVLPNTVLLVAEMYEPLSTNPNIKSSENGVTSTSGIKATIVGYARGQMIHISGHQSATRGLWNPITWKSSTYLPLKTLNNYLHICSRLLRRNTRTENVPFQHEGLCQEADVIPAAP